MARVADVDLIVGQMDIARSASATNKAHIELLQQAASKLRSAKKSKKSSLPQESPSMRRKGGALSRKQYPGGLSKRLFEWKERNLP